MNRQEAQGSGKKNGKTETKSQRGEQEVIATGEMEDKKAERNEQIKNMQLRKRKS